VLELAHAVERLKYKLQGKPVPPDHLLALTTTAVVTMGEVREGKTINPDAFETEPQVYTIY
jgi:hypothetical protein